MGSYLELHALTRAAHSYAVLIQCIDGQTLLVKETLMSLIEKPISASLHVT